MYLFDLTGPAFLSFYIPLLLVAVLLAFVLRWGLRTPGGVPSRKLPEFAGAEAAYLAHGARGAVHAAVMSLVHRDNLEIESGKLTIGPVEKGIAHPLELAIYDAVRKRHQDLKAILRAVDHPLRQMAAPMEQQQLIFPRSSLPAAKWAPVLLMFAVLGIGATKLVIGINRNRPVGILVILCVAAFVVMAGLLISPVHRTRRGDKVLKSLRRRHEALRTTAQAKMSTLGPDDAALALGLFGGAMLMNEESDLRRLLKADVNTAGSSCASGGCGGSSCGGGGCGGGGCGGCGGGCGS